MAEREPDPNPGRQPGPTPDRQPGPRGGDSQRGAIAGLLIAIVLLAIGIWLAHDLTAASKLQDCVMSGRTNCNVIEPAR
ncbi:MAG TPA: hypothetical protein VFB02_11965 [Bradyrhizobium sp.]|jgi:hypothetical protein|nr:hypothetical protein [Bradyrhizobium sp.]